MSVPLQMVIDNRSQLIYALTEAAELEHLLMCQYLFAAFSLKTRLSELPNAQRKFHQVELIRGWKKAILNIAREEMQHLTYVNNLLIAVGGAPYFARPNFPSSNRFYRSGPNSPGLEMSLESFRPETIERFIRFEQAVPDRLPFEALLAAVPDPNYYQSIGELYRAIDAAFDRIPIIDALGEYDPLDEGGESIRLTRTPDLKNTVETPADAHKLIQMIVAEGEGSTSNDPNAHVNIFRRIRDELQSELSQDPKFEPARHVISNPLVRWHDDIEPVLKSKAHVIDKSTDDGLQYELLQLFNGAYEVLITWLAQLFARQGSPQELNAIQTLAFMPYMTEVVRPLSELLTTVPIQIGASESLGASWEVTSNNFLVPKGEATGLITVERLTELASSSDRLVGMLAKKQLTSQAANLSFIQKTLANVVAEFQSRIKHGWPPASTVVTTYSESPKGLWISNKNLPPVLQLEFQGWLQCRLATDYDGAHEPRGVTGNGFAIGSEPDLDRIIRLQPEGACIRAHCPNIGVMVTGAWALRSPQHAPDTGVIVHKLIGAKVRLLGEPKFEGRNHVVSEDGEPIDPFDLVIDGSEGVKLRRSVDNRKAIVDMTPTERRGTGRYPTSVSASISNLLENLRRCGGTVVPSPTEYVQRRLKDLNDELKTVTDPIGEQAEAVKFRIAVISQALNFPPSIRWIRFFFDAQYFHTLSGPMEVELSGASPQLKPLGAASGTKPDPSRWAINYHIGMFDTDALSAFMYGILRIPLELFPSSV